MLKQNYALYCFKRYWLLGLTLAAIALIWTSHSNQLLFYKINAWHVYLPDMVWSTVNFISYSRFYILPILLIILTFLLRRDKLLNSILVVLAYYVVFYSLKFVVGEARPYMVLDQGTFFWLNYFEDAVKSAHRSFPSGHAGNMSVFVFGLIYLFFQKNILARILLISLLAFTMFTRICTGWHWPIDVLASSVVAFLLVKICYGIQFSKLEDPLPPG